MSNVDFRDLVARLRVAQRRYFAERSRDALGEAKRLEREVDGVLEDPEGRGQAVQGELFGKGKGGGDPVNPERY